VPGETKLSVNIDHVATVRQARRAAEPDPVTAAHLCELAGAHGITCHIRGDRRHVNERDLDLLRRSVKTSLNVEMAATEEMLGIALEIRPDLVTLVPERPEEVTTEGGIDAAGGGEPLKRHIEALTGGGLKVSLFIDPAPEQVKAAAALGAGVVELNTARYSESRGAEALEPFQVLEEMARLAADSGLLVAAGHGLDYRNVEPVARLVEVEELNIGHAIVARSVLVGIDQAVREMLALLL
jgi:pyridoxine 5-phosphate synthase